MKKKKILTILASYVYRFLISVEQRMFKVDSSTISTRSIDSKGVGGQEDVIEVINRLNKACRMPRGRWSRFYYFVKVSRMQLYVTTYYFDVSQSPLQFQCALRGLRSSLVRSFHEDRLADKPRANVRLP